MPDSTSSTSKADAGPDPDRPGEVLVSEPFARAHQLQPGDRIEATLRGRRIFLTTSGIALSPEFVIQLKPGEIFPDDPPLRNFLDASSPA